MPAPQGRARRLVVHVAFIGMGANLGHREATIRAALDRLRQAPGVAAVTSSSLHETAAVGGPAGQPPYLNGAARIETTLEPEPLLDLLLNIERMLGRVRREKWGPRIIDLDLLLFDDRVIDTPRLTVPHPRLHERRFVLEPLAEVAGEVRHPVLNQTIPELLARLPGAG
ncbi:MAG: 2-amino-4-hydroxy-6-hydroxymethyldihydropteridine diphosphokinase [Planctomycetes bacterium]|nr:2-amino-4-hydroxy-6-hydroxymethyldihydropteridine diphosphokinase [Planctomycetota bacterium]